MMKKIFSLMLLCTAVIFASCGNDDDEVAVSGITLDKTTMSIAVGETGALKATIAPENAADKSITWSSDKTEIATVKDGVVTAVAAGTATITATSVADKAKKAACVVTVEALNYVEVNGIKVAVGNLVADGANGAKIGTATDGGLLFQFGSLVGWSTTGSPTVAVSPVGCAVTSWNSSWTGDPATENVATGTGDPCKYYLKGTWRLPTNDEYKALFNNVTDDSYANSGGWSWDATAKSATNNTKNLTFPASGCRSYDDGSLYRVGMNGYYWSASPDYASNGYFLYFGSSIVLSSNSDNRASGLSVRCVQNASN